LFLNLNRLATTLVCITALLFVSIVLFGGLPTQANQSKEKSDKKNVLKGRVLAYIDSMAVGSGVGPLYETFIFGVESKGERGAQVITPFEVYTHFLIGRSAYRIAFSIIRSSMSCMLCGLPDATKA
jgi:hypothetical protein